MCGLLVSPGELVNLCACVEEEGAHYGWVCLICFNASTFVCMYALTFDLNM